MNPGRHDSGEPVTVLVFKDNFAARSFQFPLGWFSRLGFLMGTAGILTVASTSIALYWYVQAHRLSPARLQDLELQVQDLRVKLTQATVPQPQASPPILTAMGPAPNANPLTPEQPVTAPATPQKLASAPTGPASGATPGPAPLVLAPIQGGPGQNPLPGPIRLTGANQGPLVANLPVLRSTESIPDVNNLAFRLSPLQTEWRGRTLQVRSSIQYIADDGGNQQGRIVILARGPETLLAYPKGVLDTSHAGSLINPERGEFFSVSRMRPIQADFGPLEPRTSITEVTILILSQSGQVLYQERSEINISPPVRSAPRPKPSPAALEEET